MVVLDPVRIGQELCPKSRSTTTMHFLLKGRLDTLDTQLCFTRRDLTTLGDFRVILQGNECTFTLLQYFFF
jgi:hypothetical protein